MSDPTFEVRAAGAFDVVKINWPGVRVERLQSDEATYGLEAQVLTSQSGVSIWRVDPCDVGPLLIRGVDENGFPQAATHYRAPCAQDGVTHFLRLRITHEPSIWGSDVTAVVELLDVDATIADMTLPSDTLRMAFRIERPNQPPAERPFRVLAPQVLTAIRSVRDQVNSALVEFRQRHEDGEIPFSELKQHLLSHKAALGHISEQGVIDILLAEEIERRNATSALHRINSMLGRHVYRQAEQKIWPRALAQLVAKRLTHEQVLNSGLIPVSKRQPLGALRLADNDLLEVIHVPQSVALLVELTDGARRWARHASVQLRDGRMTWSTRNDHLAEQEIADFVKDVPTLRLPLVDTGTSGEVVEDLLRIDISDAEIPDQLEAVGHFALPDWLLGAAVPSDAARTAFAQAYPDDRSEEQADQAVMAWLIDKGWRALYGVRAENWSRIDDEARQKSEQLGGVLLALNENEELANSLMQRLCVALLEPRDAGPPTFEHLLLAVGLETQNGEDFLEALKEDNLEQATLSARAALGLGDLPDTFVEVV